ncbi:dipeptidase [Aminobacterium colombiense]
MNRRKKCLGLAWAVPFCCLLVLVSTPSWACTAVLVGRSASADGSVINSHTADNWYDANLRVVKGQKYSPGTMMDVYINLLGEDANPPRVIGQIPQAEETYTYFHIGYSCFNEHQLSIGESTVGQKDELSAFLPDAKGILTIEQLEIIALQRTKTAREAIKLMGELAETYGFLPSCVGQGEALTIADPNEAWIFEIRSVGFMWKPGSGIPGAVWAAQRVPDDEVAVVTNGSVITEIDLSQPSYFMASKNYQDVAIQHGWYKPGSRCPFNWREAYSPRSGYWSMYSDWIRQRLHYLFKTLDPSKEWDPNADVSFYPFSIKPKKKISVQDVMTMQRSTLEGTPFNMEDNPAWLVPDVNGKLVKSELATPFPDNSMRDLLNIPYHRPISAKTSYSFVSQSRSWLPAPVGGILWFSMGHPHMGVYVPVYAGTTIIPKEWQNFKIGRFDQSSARWVFYLAADLVNRRYQLAFRDMEQVRVPFERELFEKQAEIEKKAVKLWSSSPELGTAYLNEISNNGMKDAMEKWWDLCTLLISKYMWGRVW